MSGFLDRLLQKERNELPLIQPALPARFENAALIPPVSLPETDRSYPAENPPGNATPSTNQAATLPAQQRTLDPIVANQPSSTIQSPVADRALTHNQGSSQQNEAAQFIPSERVPAQLTEIGLEARPVNTIVPPSPDPAAVHQWSDVPMTTGQHESGPASHSSGPAPFTTLDNISLPLPDADRQPAPAIVPAEPATGPASSSKGPIDPVQEGLRSSPVLPAQSVQPAPILAERQAPETPVRISIGRIEVRAARPTPPPVRPTNSTRKPPLSLDAYLKQRNGGRS